MAERPHLSLYEPQLFFGMSLGEKRILDPRRTIIRVPGGWVFEALNGVLFIPYHVEFRNSPKGMDNAGQDIPPNSAA